MVIKSNVTESGAIIRTMREVSGLSQMDIAEALGLKSSSSIHYWESGKRGVPSHYMAKIAKLCGFRLEWIASNDAN